MIGFLAISEVLSSENSDFHDLSALGDLYALYHFYVIFIHNIRCLEPFLPVYDHFEICRILGLNWQLAETLSYQKQNLFASHICLHFIKIALYNS